MDHTVFTLQTHCICLHIVSVHHTVTPLTCFLIIVFNIYFSFLYNAAIILWRIEIFNSSHPIAACYNRTSSLKVNNFLISILFKDVTLTCAFLQWLCFILYCCILKNGLSWIILLKHDEWMNIYIYVWIGQQEWYAFESTQEEFGGPRLSLSRRPAVSGETSTSTAAEAKHRVRLR